MTFRRIIEIEGDISSKSQVDKPPHGPSNKPKSPTRNQEISPGPAVQLQQLSGSTPEENKQQVAINRKRKREYARDNELDLDLHLENIRRVRIRTVSRGVTERFEVLFGFFEENGKPEPAFCYGFRTEDDESCLIIEFEDNNNGALCDTIDQQAFKLGGLFETELVKAESIIEDAEECDRQITWMEEDEVQMYLRFKSQKDREFIWKFIISAWSRSIMRQGHRYQPVPGQHITETETYSENPKPHALTPLPVSQTCSEPGCSRQFRRPYDLKKHEKSHTRPWKCPVKACYYHEYGWSTEKEMERHHDDKHGDAPAFYECLFKPCPYRSKRESNCKQHMEKAHGWTYVRSKSNGKSKDKAGQAGEASPDPLPVPQNTNASDYNEISSISIQSSTADTDSFGYPSNLNSDMFTTPLVDTTWAPSLPEWLHDFHNNTPSYDVADNTFDWPSYPDFGFNNAEFSFFGENEDPQQGPLPDTIEKSQNLLPEVKDLDSVEENKNIPKDIKQSPRRDTHDLYPSWPQDTISQRDGLFSFEDIPTPLLQPNSYQQGGPYSLFEDPKRGAIREIITQSDSHSWSKNTQHGVYRELTSQSGSGDTGARKRALNTLAARISRQRKMQQFNELEEKIVKLEKERDHWRSVADESLGETHTMQVVEPVSMTDMQKVDIEIHQDAMQVDERGP
ncbi:hypothetical protein F5884DRAFT_508116 [Xylogone sp. PMI_703]|nr:hypothetical protein F5884DRAFT_508116 [Xylogone sp. PMI_703]